MTTRDPIRVHLIGGLPTPLVCRGLERIRERLPLRSFEAFVDGSTPSWTHGGLLLPPHVETSQIVEDWESSDFLAHRFGSGSQLGNTITLVDAEQLAAQLACSHSIGSIGWGRDARDARSVADIAVGQIESALRLVVVGRPSAHRASHALLRAMNPSAAVLPLDDATDAELGAFLAGACPSSARVVPPWLDLLRAEGELPSEPDRFLYRRSLPFDPRRFAAWLANPPGSLLRGKGKLWLADRSEQALGYSCAGAVHRVFQAGRWWAGAGGTLWPSCENERTRLLVRWHPHFGDRRQEIAFVGAGLDADEISAGLDACLLTEEEALAALRRASPEPRARASAAQGVELH